MPDQDRIVILLSRRVAGELSPAEAEELDLALQQDPTLRELAAAFEGLSDAPPKGITTREERMMLEKGLRQWKQLASGQVPAVPLEPTSYDNNTLQIPTANPYRRLIRWSAAAAILILIASAAWFFKGGAKPPQTPPVVWREMAAKYGTRNYLDLPDGSRMWLNAGSKVRYADGFSEGKRALTLRGEAYFDIKHDPENPFMIYVGDVAVKVLGTSLNVKAYPGDSVIEATLIQGKAEIEVPGSNNAPIALRPSEKITVYNGHFFDGDDKPTGPAKPAPTPATWQRHNVVADPTFKTVIETSWVEDKLAFRKEPFQEVATKLERWYNIRIRFAGNKYQNDELTGYFKDQPIKNVMDALQVSLGFHYELTGDSILIK